MMIFSEKIIPFEISNFRNEIYLAIQYLFVVGLEWQLILLSGGHITKKTALCSFQRNVIIVILYPFYF